MAEKEKKESLLDHLVNPKSGNQLFALVCLATDDRECMQYWEMYFSISIRHDYPDMPLKLGTHGVWEGYHFSYLWC